MGFEGKIVFASGKQGDYDIWRLDLGTGDFIQLTHGNFWNDAPKWSPDGRGIIFVSNRTGYSEIWMMDEFGNDQVQLTDKKRLHFTPAWHPNGKTIVFCANYKGNLDIFTMDIDSKDIRQITDYSGIDSTPQFSPDGNKVVFTSQRSGNDDIWEYDFQSNNCKQLTTHPAQDFSPAYSPDGGKIAFVSGRTKYKQDVNLDIFIMNADGSGEQRLTRNQGADRYVTWSPDAKCLLYTSSPILSSAERLMIFDLEKIKIKELGFERAPLEEEIDAKTVKFGLFAFLPESVSRMFHSKEHFGTERHPDWTI